MKLTLRPLLKAPASAAAPREQEAAPVKVAAVPAAPAPAVSAGPSQQQIEEELCELLAEVLFIERAALRRDRPFNDLGLDSILGVEFMQAINEKYGLKLKATMLYEHSNLVSLAGLVATSRSGGAATKVAVKVEQPASAPRAPDALDMLLSGVESGSLSVEAATLQLAKSAAPAAEKQRDPEPGSREAIFAVVKRNLLTVLPHVPPAEVQIGRSMTDLGANSLDRADVVIAVLEELRLKIPQARLAQARDLSSLVDVLHEFARAKPDGA